MESKIDTTKRSISVVVNVTTNRQLPVATHFGEKEVVT